MLAPLSLRRLAAVAVSVSLCVWTSKATSLARPAQEGAKATSESRRLSPPERIDREIGAGASQSYELELASDLFVHFDVEQLGIDVAITLVGPDGQTLSEIDSTTGAEKNEAFSIIGTPPGVYRFTVHVGDDADPANGRYVLQTSEPRRATDQDRHVVLAERAAHSGLQLWLEDTEEASRAALERYDLALGEWRAAGVARGQADVLSMSGAIRDGLGDLKGALAAFQAELPIRVALKDREGEAVAASGIAVQQQKLGNPAAARAGLERALVISREIADRELEGATLSKLAYVKSQLGLRREAQKDLEVAIPLLEEHGEVPERARAYLARAELEVAFGERGAALSDYEKALELFRSSSDTNFEAGALIGIGEIEAARGNLGRALSLHRSALDISRKSGDKVREALALGSLGYVYEQLGAFDDAVAHFTAALAVARATGDRGREAVLLNNIGAVWAAAGRGLAADDARSTRYYGLALQRWRATKDTNHQASALLNLARLDVRGGRAAAALSKLRAADRLAGSDGMVQTRASIGKVRGDALVRAGRPAQALEAYAEALPLMKKAGFPGGDATVLLGMARAERARGRLDEARTLVEQAIGIVEEIRSDLPSQELRADYFGRAQIYFEFYIDLLMSLHEKNPSGGFDREAFRASERARARSLVELIAQARADVGAGLDPAASGRLASLRERLAAKTELQIVAGAAGRKVESDELSREVTALTTEYREAIAAARAADPRYADLVNPAVLSVQEVQTAVLDADTALVEYSLGERRSFVWVVTSNGFGTVVLPPRARIEREARAVHKMLQSRPGTEPNATRREATYVAAAGRLSRMVLGAIGEDVGSRRLAVAADGALQLIPFAALPTPWGAGRAPKPLIVEREVVHVPSASTVAILRRQPREAQASDAGIAVFADPVFDRNDPRVTATTGTYGAPPAGAGDDAALIRDLGIVDSAPGAVAGDAPTEVRIPRLPGTRAEADEIGRLAGADKSKMWLDFGASRAGLLDADLARFGILHIGTHGFAHPNRPELSGLLMSRFGEDGKKTQGLVLLGDLFTLRLRARVVVLSACRTGLGANVRGEGFVGLARAFMYAGAPSVVVSLWSVGDESTAELMKGFYSRMLKDGKPGAAALRGAQIDLWNQKRWSAPFYWAPFVMQGDWKE